LATIVGVALPFFAVLLCGMLAARLRLLDDAGLIGLNAFVFWFALPALLFQKVATTAFDRLTDWTLYVGYEGSCLLVYFVVLAAVRWLARRSLREAAICASPAPRPRPPARPSSPRGRLPWRAWNQLIPSASVHCPRRRSWRMRTGPMARSSRFLKELATSSASPSIGIELCRMEIKAPIGTRSST